MKKVNVFFVRLFGGRSTSQKRHANDAKRSRIEKRIGRGTFGEVFQAKDKETRQKVAIKKLQYGQPAQTELDFNAQLLHVNVARLLGHFVEDRRKPPGKHLCLVLEFSKQSLKDLIDENRRKKRPMQQGSTMIYTYQIFRALHYLHTLGIVHRDVKPSNFLVSEVKIENRKAKRLQICDFGSATKLVAGEARSIGVVSKPYRAPELELGNQDYTEKIAIWSAGCIFVECCTNEKLFRDLPTLTQYNNICEVLGDPKPEEIFELQPLLKGQTLRLPQNPRPAVVDQRLARFRPTLSAATVVLIKRILQFKPSLRPAAFEVLADPYFNRLRQWKEQDALLYNYSEEEVANIPPPILARIVPGRCREDAVLKKLAEAQLQDLHETSHDTLMKSWAQSTMSQGVGLLLVTGDDTGYTYVL